MYFHWLLLALILKSSFIFGDVEYKRVIRQAGGNTCVDPENRLGLCVEIKNCKPLFELLSRAHEQAVANFLSKSQCAPWANKEQQPKVCCHSGISPFLPPSTSTSRTTTSAAFNPHLCGRSSIKPRKIVGGKNSTLGDWPWIAALGYQDRSKPTIQFYCGGSVISNSWIVTAAHCIINTDSLKLTTVRLGDLDLDDGINDGATPQDFVIEQIFTHPDYHLFRYPTNDIALLKLKDTITFTEFIRPICIMSGDKYKTDMFYNGKEPFVAGWGALEYRGPRSTHLKDLQIEIINQNDCAQNYSQSAIDERVLCAAGKGKDACQGDSGGPLMIPIGSEIYLSGIVSYGIGCADMNYPGVYTRVAYFADWIKRTTGV